MDGVGAVEGSNLSGGRRLDEEESDKNVQNQVCFVIFVAPMSFLRSDNVAIVHI